MSNKNSSWKFNLVAIAAVLTATAATAPAQNIELKADVPFAFSVNSGAHLPQGTYLVSRKGDIWWFRSPDGSHAGAVVAYVARRGHANEQPSLTFACLHDRCQIVAIHMGGPSMGIDVPGPKLSKSDREELAVVNVPLRLNEREEARR